MAEKKKRPPKRVRDGRTASDNYGSGGLPKRWEEAKTTVYVLYTGGTIGMTRIGGKDSPLVPGNIKEFENNLQAHPDYQHNSEEIYYYIDSLKDQRGDVIGPLDSSSVGPTNWCQIAAAIERVYNDWDGFIVLHGTDTMAFTASALSFLFNHLNKPVVITGSQLPLIEKRSDGYSNFTNALQVAGYKATGLPLVPEVVICFGDSLLRGNRTTKVSTTKLQGFDSPNYPRLGTFGEQIRIASKFLMPTIDDENTFYVDRELEKKVVTISLSPDMEAEALEAFLSTSMKGFIFQSFGNGNAQEDTKFLTTLNNAIGGALPTDVSDAQPLSDQRNKKIVVNITQCLEGTVEMGLYAASSGLQSAGVISGLDMTPEAALTKLMWLLKVVGRDEARAQMQINQRGEQSGSIFEIEYLSPDLPDARLVSKKQKLKKMQLDEYKINYDDLYEPILKGGDNLRKNMRGFRFSKTFRPAGQINIQKLKRAILRIINANSRSVSEVIGTADLNGISSGETAAFHVFINFPEATHEDAANTHPENAKRQFLPQYAGIARGYRASDSEYVDVYADVTETVRRVFSAGRPLSLTLLEENSQEFTADSIYLTLFTD